MMEAAEVSPWGSEACEFATDASGHHWAMKLVLAVLAEYRLRSSYTLRPPSDAWKYLPCGESGHVLMIANLVASLNQGEGSRF